MIIVIYLLAGLKVLFFTKTILNKIVVFFKKNLYIIYIAILTSYVFE